MDHSLLIMQNNYYQQVAIKASWHGNCLYNISHYVRNEREKKIGGEATDSRCIEDYGYKIK